MIASLLNVPRTQQEWDTWSFNHKIEHDNIIRAALAQKNKMLTTYILDPINEAEPDVFLQNNSQMHIDICSLLNVSGSDLTGVNWQDDEQIKNWIYLHWQEHTNFNSTLGI